MIRTRCIAIIVFFVALMVAGERSKAEDLNFLGVDIFAEKGTFLVTKKANVRVGPMTKSKKLGELKSGEEVRVVGRAKKGAGWMAIQKDGAPVRDIVFIERSLISCFQILSISILINI